MLLSTDKRKWSGDRDVLVEGREGEREEREGERGRERKERGGVRKRGMGREKERGRGSN